MRKETNQRAILISVILSMLGIALVDPRVAFPVHEKGVAHCDACHVTHGLEDGRPVVPSASNGWALRGDTASDLCLMCHADANGATLAPSPLTPSREYGGGNFIFLIEDNINDAADGVTRPIPGFAAGHNLVAPTHGLGPDPRFAVSPGGTFPASEMGCTSCHDPHGNSNYRMLYGAGSVLAGRFSFSAPAPDASGIELGSEGESDANHSAYRRGVSAWCGNCHGRYHESVGADFEHPVDELLTRFERDQYSRYDGDENPEGGFPSRAYLPEVPFEDPAASTDSTSGPTPSSRVMCLSCHRAHASSAPAAGRWDFNVALLSEDGVISGSHAIPSPYRDPNQGTLCRKCHESGSSPAE